MQKFKSGKISPVALGIFLLVIIGAGAAAAFVLQNNKFAMLDPFPIDTYTSKPSNMLGNKYGLDAIIDSQIAWKEGTGKIMTIKPVSATSTRLPIFLSDKLQGTLHVGQRYRMQIMIDQRGLIMVEAMEKY